MSISLKTHKMLWGRSGMMCAFPDCKKELVSDESETDDPSLIGEEAHIVGKTENSPRGESDLSIEQRDKFDNLILLCSAHHKIVDDQVNTFTVEILRNYKREHLSWVKNNLSQDLIKQREDELYASYVDKFLELAKVDIWMAWTSWLFGGDQPRIHQEMLENLRTLNEFIISRVWSGKYPQIEKAFYNFKNVSDDFVKVFSKYAERKRFSSDDADEMIWTEKFYKITEYNPEIYHKLGDKYDYHCLLVEDLVLEMTRAANHLFDMVRKYLFTAFRIEEGVLLVQIGPFSDFSFKTFRVEYAEQEKLTLYQGLKNFMKDRNQRDYCRGTGISEDYFSSF